MLCLIKQGERSNAVLDKTIQISKWLPASDQEHRQPLTIYTKGTSHPRAHIFLII